MRTVLSLVEKEQPLASERLSCNYLLWLFVAWAHSCLFLSHYLNPGSTSALFIDASTMLAVILTEILNMLVCELQERYDRVVVQSVVAVLATHLDMHALTA